MSSCNRLWRLVATPASSSLSRLFATAAALSVLASCVLVAQTTSVVPVATATLRPGDALRVRVSKEPDLSGEFMVDEHGEVTLPRLGRRLVLGLAIDTVRAHVIRDYEQVLRDVTIEVTPLYRVRVTGAVRNPGLFTVDATMSVADAIGLAGGVSPQGRNGRVSLMRDGQELPTPVSPAARLVDLKLRSSDEIYIPERPWLARNAGVAIGAVSAAASLLWAFRR